PTVNAAERSDALQRTLISLKIVWASEVRTLILSFSRQREKGRGRGALPLKIVRASHLRTLLLSFSRQRQHRPGRGVLALRSVRVASPALYLSEQAWAPIVRFLFLAEQPSTPSSCPSPSSFPAAFDG